MSRQPAIPDWMLLRRRPDPAEVGMDHVMANLGVYAHLQMLESRARYEPICRALMAAGWTLELDSTTYGNSDHETEPYQWQWRRPPRRPGKLGRLFKSTDQAWNALRRERGEAAT